MCKIDATNGIRPFCCRPSSTFVRRYITKTEIRWHVLEIKIPAQMKLFKEVESNPGATTRVNVLERNC